MDPQACYLLMLGALGAGDFDGAYSHMSDLRDWLESGGFPPTGMITSFALALCNQVALTCAAAEGVELD